ncbi:MAG: xylulokinase [Spirochaetota bacterium]
MKYVLGIDVGTTGTKSALFDSQGSLIDTEYRSYPISYPGEGWAEQDARDWWNAVVETTRGLVSRRNCSSEVVSMSLSTQGGALVILDDRFNPVYPAVSWLDTRATEVQEELTRHISARELYEMDGWPVTGGLNFPTIFWFRRKLPHVLEKASFFASTVDYLNFLLTGNFAIDYTNLALTMFLDLGRRDWSERALNIAGINRNNVARIIPSGKRVGTLTPKAAETLGLSSEVKVVSGAHDQYCASLGAGAVEYGDCILSSGTAWVLLATCDRLYYLDQSLERRRVTSGVFPGLHPLEGKYGVMTSVPFGGNSLKWFRDVFRPGTSYEQLSQDASRVPHGCEGLMFVPIASSASGKGAFLRIDGVHTVGHFTRAVLEGVAFVNRRHLELIKQAGVNVRNFIMTGGGSNSTLWPQIVSDISNVPVFIPELKEAACAGAALLAGAGAGVFVSLKEMARRITGKNTKITPQQKNVEMYRELYQDYIKLTEYI